MSPTLLSLIGGIVAALAGGFLYDYRKQKQIYRQLSRTDAKNPSEIDGDGIVEVEGTVGEPLNDFVEHTMREWRSPVATGWEIDEWEKTDNDSYWMIRGHGVHTVPFALVGEGNKNVVVDLGSADGEPSSKGWLYRDEKSTWPFPDSTVAGDNGVDVDGLVFVTEEFDYFTEVNQGSEPPERVVAFLDRFETIDAVKEQFLSALDFGRNEGTRRYIEEAVEVGDTVYIRGKAVSSGETWETSIRIEAPEDGYAIISTVGEEEIERRFEGSSLRYKIAAGATAIGLLLFIIGFAI